MWLALHLPTLALDALPPSAAERPRAVVETAAGRERLGAVCSRAAAAGVRAGMEVAAALALLPGLELALRRPIAERAMLESLAVAVGRYSSQVALTDPPGVVVEVGRSLRLFGSIDALITALCGTAAGCGLAAGHALAPTPAAATLLARVAPATVVSQPAALRGVLAGVPVATLPVAAPLVARLRGMGIETLGQLARLPRDGLARRCGTGLLDLLDRLYGRRPELPLPYRPLPGFSHTLALPVPAAELDVLVQALDLLLAELEAFLRPQGRAAARLRLELHHRDADATTVTLELTAPTGERAHLHALLAARLERLTLTRPVQAVTLHAKGLVGLTSDDAADLFDVRAGQAAARLVERLQARLGPDGVHALVPHADHRPEHAWRAVPPGTAPPAPPPASAAPPWLLSRPHRLASRAGRPWQGGWLQLDGAPRRIEAGWWAGAEVRRDYYVASAPSGRRLWVYRDHVHGGWYLHGIYG